MTDMEKVPAGQPRVVDRLYPLLKDDTEETGNQTVVTVDDPTSDGEEGQTPPITQVKEESGRCYGITVWTGLMLVGVLAAGAITIYLVTISASIQEMNIDVIVTDINECEENNGGCLNGGICVNTLGSMHCNCNGTGFEGPKCKEDINEC